MPSLDRPADRDTLQAYFSSAAAIATFPNLGGDATLVVPTPRADDSAYGHIAAFVRNAPTDQQHELWKAVADAMAANLADRPLWLSTAGAGVAWLHVRLDQRPKYYQHRPFASRDATT